MFWKSGRILRLYATGGTVALFAAHAIFFRGEIYASFEYLPHLLSGCSIALFLLGLAVIAIPTYFPHQVSSKSKSKSKPEPKPKALAKAAGAD
jgi:hypothetical protein